MKLLALLARRYEIVVEVGLAYPTRPTTNFTSTCSCSSSILILGRQADDDDYPLSSPHPKGGAGSERTRLTMTHRLPPARREHNDVVDIIKCTRVDITVGITGAYGVPVGVIQAFAWIKSFP